MVDIHKIIEQALKRKASDIHLMLDEKPIYRVGTSLVKMQESTALKREDMDEIYNYFANGNIQNTVDVKYEYKGTNFEVNLSSANKNSACTIKVLKHELPEYEKLGLPDILRNITYQSQGLILVAGNKKSGKTTTLNALVRHINETQNKKIITLEKNIEYKHNSRNSVIIQKQIGVDFLTYQEGVKNALKEDCDILIVEDIRNQETMETIFEIIEAGGLVIAGINTTTYEKVKEKIINFYDEKEQTRIKYLLSEFLKLVISQKLLLGTKGKLELLSEVTVPQNSEQNISLLDSLANLYVKNKITLKQAKSQIEEKDFYNLNTKIMLKRIREEIEKSKNA